MFSINVFSHKHVTEVTIVQNRLSSINVNAFEIELVCFFIEMVSFCGGNVTLTEVALALECWLSNTKNPRLTTN